jgi:hypothetical protein
MKQEIYVDVRHSNFWWGIYNLTPATDWEDLIFFEKQADDLVRIGAVCVCSRRYLQDALADLKDDPEEKGFVQDLEQFLQEQRLTYHYWYSNPDEENFSEVPFDAPCNEKGVKPCYIEMWYPGEGIDLEAVKACTMAFCRSFLHKERELIVFKEIPSFEETVQSYRKQMALQSNGTVQLAFSDDLVASLAQRWKKSTAEVLKILFRSL